MTDNADRFVAHKDEFEIIYTPTTPSERQAERRRRLADADARNAEDD